MRTPSGGLARPDAPGQALTAAELIEHAQSRMAPGHDLCVLWTTARATRPRSGWSPTGWAAMWNDSGRVHGGAAGRRGGDPGEVVPIDRVSGAVVDGLVQPPGLATTLPGWFELAVRPGAAARGPGDAAVAGRPGVSNTKLELR